MIIIDSITKTCDACPAQWEGKARDGSVVYVRYRCGTLRIGFGIDLAHAVRDSTFERTLGDGLDGSLSMSELRIATEGVISWP